MASMVLQLGLQLLAGRRPRLFKHGEQKRDFVFIEDVVQANLRALGAKQSGVYNVGSGRAREFRELLAILQDTLGVHRDTEFIDNPWEFYQDHTEADLTATADALGYAPRFTLEAGIESYAADIRRLAKRKSSCTS
jgi:ADP-L-glycero-D-manno-heptose 6-epimerase